MFTYFKGAYRYLEVRVTLSRGVVSMFTYFKGAYRYLEVRVTLRRGIAQAICSNLSRLKQEFGHVILVFSLTPLVD